MAMETMTRVNEQMDVAAKKPMAVQPGVARMRELTPAQRRAVMFAQQQGRHRWNRRDSVQSARRKEEAGGDRGRQEGQGSASSRS